MAVEYELHVPVELVLQLLLVQLVHRGLGKGQTVCGILAIPCCLLPLVTGAPCTRPRRWVFMSPGGPSALAFCFLKVFGFKQLKNVQYTGVSLVFLSLRKLVSVALDE